MSFTAYFLDGPLKGERRRFSRQSPYADIRIPLAPELNTRWVQPIPDDLETARLPVGFYRLVDRVRDETSWPNEYTYRFSGVRVE